MDRQATRLPYNSLTDNCEALPRLISDLCPLLYRAADALLQSDLAHQLVAHDLPNLHPFDRTLPLSIFAPEDFVSDRIGFFPQTIERGHVFVLHHQQDIEVLRVSFASGNR